VGSLNSDHPSSITDPQRILVHLRGQMRWVFIKLENRIVLLLQRDSYGKNVRSGRISRKVGGRKMLHEKSYCSLGLDY